MPRSNVRCRFIAAFAAANFAFSTGVPLAEASVDRRDSASAAMTPAIDDDPQSLYALGAMFLDGRGKPQDFAAARAAFKAAAQRGYWRAQLVLGFMAERGLGSPPDFAEAARRFRKAAEFGQSEAQTALGLVLATGGHGLKRDDSQAVAWLALAARQGSAEAAFSLGMLMSRHQRYAEALTWLRQASDGGDAEAANYIATIFDFGFGVPENPPEALKWHLLAAGRGNADSLFRLGPAYLDGRHAPEDRVQAYRWLLIAIRSGTATSASAQNLKDAETNRAVLAAMMSNDQINQAEALTQGWVPHPVPNSEP